MTHHDIPKRWQRIAWAIGAHDLATDMDENDPEFTAWAESAHGGTARLALVIARAIAETTPVHNHGPVEGRGLYCSESLVNGRLRGACIGRVDETDPWPTAPLIVATLDTEGPRTVYMRNGDAYESTDNWVQADTGIPLTNVVPVTVVPTAALQRARESYTDASVQIAYRDLGKLLVETDALGVDLT